VTAKRIVHDAESKTIYYEGAALEFYGVPIIYLPYFSTPDPTVTRKSGVLAPKYSFNSQVGFGLSVPYFFDLAPNYDLTVTPSVYTRQGAMLSGEWRHRLLNGAYNIQASGIFQADPGAFVAAPYGVGSHVFRGSVQSSGEFSLNQNWKFGWNISLASDKFYKRDYGDSSQIISSTFFGVNTSTAYLTGQGAQSYFDLRGYYFEALSPSVLQRQQPVVSPVLSYDRAFELDPKDSGGIGGQFELDTHFAHLDQSLATYQATGFESLDQAFNLYDVCETAKVPTYKPGACLLRGIAGDYTNASVTASWQRKFIDPIGDVWTPFAFAHLSGTFLDLNTSNSATFTSSTGSSTLPNSAQPGLLGLPVQSVVGEAIPGVGTEWRYPLISKSAWGTQILEPIAQIIARPNESPTAAQINEDSQSLVFDDTNLFQWNKFSGADRFEGGTRLNYGAQYALILNNGGYANILFGQSYQLAGQNSYATQDALAVGLGSGLSNRSSDYVARLQLAPTSHLALIAKTNLDPSTWQPKRIDVSANAIFGNWEASLDYARYVAQPSIGYYVTRQGLSPTLKINIAKDFFIDGNVVFDLSRHYYNAAFGAEAPLFSVAGLGLGVGYSNDCATLSVNYTSVYQADLVGPAQRNQTVALNLQLRTLGDTQIRSGLAELKVEDGLQTVH
jgi:LPS-assembly protein